VSLFNASMSLALSADVVVAAEDARACELQQRAGAGVARLLAMTGREIFGKTARELGVVEEHVPAERTEETAIAIAREMAAHLMYGKEMVKRVMRGTAVCSYTKRSKSSVTRRLLWPHDFCEAMETFEQKRPPRLRDC
jgi:2-(1,2-epoxy-1,2-dihydrophenyl)acetyl-CoA isomerase